MPEMPLTEAEIQVLVTRARDGDTDAFASLYDHYFPQVYRYTAFRAPRELTEDLVADVFVKAWEKLYQYKARANVSFGAWLFRIARHTVIDAYRSQRDFDEVSEEYADTDALNQADAATRSNDIVRVVREAFAKLPRRYREILSLSYIAELSTADTARALRLSEGGVRILKLRALRKLEAFLPRNFQSDRTAARAARSGSHTEKGHHKPSFRTGQEA